MKQKFILASLSLITCASIAIASPKESKVLRFSAIPDQNTTELTAKFKPLAQYLGKKLGISVEYVPARDYQSSVELFKNGDTQLAWFGGLTGVQARAVVSGAQAIAQGKSDPQYYSYFIAHKSTKLSRSESFPKEIGALSFTFGSQSSTSGRLMPEFFIGENTGKTPSEFFAKPAGFSGSHDKTVELVCSGKYQVGAVNYKVYDAMLEQGKIKAEDCPIIWKTPPYADYNWTAHPVLEEWFGKGFTEKLQAALVGIKDEALLSAMLRKEIIPAKNEEFEGIAKVARQLNMLR